MVPGLQQITEARTRHGCPVGLTSRVVMTGSLFCWPGRAQRFIDTRPIKGNFLVAMDEVSGSTACGAAASEAHLPRAQTGRQYLVFVRAGRESLHRRLIQEDPDRNWDCCVSWYDAPQEQEHLAEYYCATGDATFSNKLQVASPVAQ